MPRKQQHKRDGIYERTDRKGFWASYTDASGRRVQAKLGDAHTLLQAQKELVRIKDKVAEERRTGVTAASEKSFKDYAEDFLKMQKRRLSSTVVRGKISADELSRQSGIIKNHLVPYFGMQIGAIRKKDVNAFINSRTGPDVSDATIIKETNTLKRMFSVAEDLEKIPKNPAKGARIPQAPDGRVRYLTPDELRSILTECPEWLRPVVGLLVATGTRRGELLKVRWEDVNVERSEILLRNTKNGKERMAFVNDLALQVLNSLSARYEALREKAAAVRDQVSLDELHAIVEQEGVDRFVILPTKWSKPIHLPTRTKKDLVFPNVTPAQVSVAFGRAVKDAKVENFTLHDLRHHYASMLRQNGVDLHTLQKLLGHSDPRMTDRYAHLSQSFLLEASRKLEGVVSLLPAPAKAQG